MSNTNLSSDKDGQSEDIFEKSDRISKKNFSGKNAFRNHEILLPKLVESDEEDETDDEEKHPCDKDLKGETQQEREKGRKDSRAAPQNILRTLRNEGPKERKKEKRDMIARDNEKILLFPQSRVRGMQLKATS